MSFRSMLQGMSAAEIRFVVIGGLAARAHGSPRLTDDLGICYDAESENVERLAALLASWAAYPRGIERGLPFFMDVRQLRTTPTLTLTTREGFVDVLDRVEGVGSYSAALKQSVEFEGFGIRFRALSLSALIAAKRATGRQKDAEQLPELEAMRALREQGDSNS